MPHGTADLQMERLSLDYPGAPITGALKSRQLSPAWEQKRLEEQRDLKHERDLVHRAGLRWKGPLDKECG